MPRIRLAKAADIGARMNIPLMKNDERSASRESLCCGRVHKKRGNVRGKPQENN